MSVNFILPFLSFLIGAFLSIIITNKKILSVIFFCSSLFSFVYSAHILSLFKIDTSLELFYNFGNFERNIGIEYALNSFNSLFLIGLTLIILIFSIFFIDFALKYDRPFQLNFIFSILQILSAASIAVLLTNDLFNFYIFFELISICSYILISLGGRGAPFSALNYLIMGMIASGLIVIGIGILYFLTGFLNISLVILKLKEGITFNLLVPFGLILTGFMIKLSLFPFSFWPALVYRNSPLSILPLYAGIVSTITFYGFYIFFSKFFPGVAVIPHLKTIVFILIFIGIVLFSFFSIVENNIRAIFAYSTIVQLSYAFFAIFMMDIKGTAAAFLHLLFNSFSKLALFIILFEIAKESKPHLYLENLNGLFIRNKVLTLYLIFFLAGIIGLPPLFGFFTKTSIILSAFSSKHYLFAALIIFGSFLNLAYFFNLISRMFFKESVERAFAISKGSNVSLILTIILLITSTFFFGTLFEFTTNSLQPLYRIYAS